MGATLAQVLPLLREHYHDNITDIFFTADKMTTPVMASMESKSMDDGLGRGYVIPVEYGVGQNVSQDFTIAQNKGQGTSAGSSALRDRWVVQAGKYEGVAYWSRDSILAAKGSGELFDVMTREMDSTISSIKKRLAVMAVERGYGRVATASAVTSTTITVSTSEVNRIDIGAQLVAGLTETGVLRSATSIRVTQVDPDTGVVTLSADPTALSWAAGDTIFWDGDHDNAASPAFLVPVGLLGWVPDTAPGSTTFQNINRQGVPALGGYRVAASGADHATTLIRLGNRLFKYGSKADMIATSAEDYSTLCIDKDATKVVEIKVGKYEIGFDAVTVSTLAGRVAVVPDAMIKQGIAWGGPFSDKKYAPFMAHNDDLVNIDDIDGNEIVRNATSTNFEMRLFFRGAIATPAPGRFAIATGLSAS